MKIGIFTDPHYCRAEVYCRTRRPSLSLKKVKEAAEHFAGEKVSLIICLGDLVDSCESHDEAVRCLGELMEPVKECGIPFRLVQGNHDYLDCRPEDFEKHSLRLPPYTEVFGDVRFIYLDANYRSSMKRFDAEGVEWTDSNLPPFETEFLRDTLARSKERCVVCVHENLDPNVETHHIIRNSAEIRRIISDSGKVTHVLQGHYHPGAENVIDGIIYRTFPAMCEGEENRYFVLDI